VTDAVTALATFRGYSVCPQVSLRFPQVSPHSGFSGFVLRFPATGPTNRLIVQVNRSKQRVATGLWLKRVHIGKQKPTFTEPITRCVIQL
jgi:hypothetical protein